MKFNIYPLIILISLSIGLSSCVKKLEQLVDPNAKTNATDLTELKANDIFDWETSSLVEISIQSLDNEGAPIPRVKISLFTNFKASEGKEILSGYTNADGLLEIDYKFASAIDSVVLGTDYLGFANEIKLPIIDKQLNYILGGIPELGTDKSTNTFYKSTAATQFTLNYLGSWKNDGTPRYLATSDKIDASFLADLNNALPENRPVPIFHPEYLYDIYDQNINLTETADVWITFVSEGAGYLNTMAFYTFDNNNPPQSISDITDVTVVFPNASFKGSGGGLSSGDKVKIGNFPAGTSIGWLLITDSYNTKSKSVTAGMDNLFSHEGLNPETDPSYQQHVVLLKDAVRDVYIISFEDMQRPGGDDDFNDAIFYATVSPSTAVDDSYFPTFGVVDSDTDGDGVPDSFDAYPNDINAAFNSYYPNQGVIAALAFEDLWPSKGDYDFNDLIVDYNILTVTNANNDVSKIIGKFSIRAIGAGFHNGFGFALDNILSSQVKSVTGSALEEGYISLNANGTEAGQTNATVIVFDDAWNHGYSNTDPTKEFAIPTDTITIELILNAPVPLAQFGIAPFNPFLIVNQERGREIHMADYAPTDLADLSYFGQYNDDSDVASGKYYKTIDNLPWIISIPTQFDYPIEKTAVDKPHLKFIPWVESSGVLFNDWYKNLTNYRNPSFVY